MFILRTCEWDLSPACRSRQLFCMPQKCDFFLTTAAATAAQTRVDVAKVIYVSVPGTTQGLPPWQSTPLHYVVTRATETRVVVSKVTGFCSWNHSGSASMAEQSIALCANSCCINEGHCFKGDRFLFLEPLRGCLHG